VVSEARSLFDREPWIIFNEAPVVVQLPEDEGSIVAQFSGSLGDLKGAFMYGSMEGFEFSQELAHSSTMDQIDSSLYSWFADSLWLIVQDPMQVHPSIRHELKPLATDDHRSTLPMPTMKRRGYLEWRASDAELVECVIGLYGLLAMATREPAALPDSRSPGIFRIKLTPDSEVTKKLLAARTRCRSSIDSTRDPPSLGKYSDKLARAWSSISPTDEVWQLGFVGRLGVVQEKPTSRPAIGFACLAVEAGTGNVLHFELTPGDTFVPRLAAKCLVKAMNESGRRPARCVVRSSPFDEELIQWLGSLIQLEISTEVPAFDEAALSLLNHRERTPWKEMH